MPVSLCSDSSSSNGSFEDEVSSASDSSGSGDSSSSYSSGSVSSASSQRPAGSVSDIASDSASDRASDTTSGAASTGDAADDDSDNATDNDNNSTAVAGHTPLGNVVASHQLVTHLETTILKTTEPYDCCFHVPALMPQARPFEPWA